MAAVAAIALVAQCHLDQLFNGGSPGQILVTPATVVASAGVGSEVAESITVSSPVEGMSWTARAVQPATWLAIAETSGTVPTTLRFSLITAGLAVGSYVDTISLSGDGAALGTTTLPVELNVVSASAQLAVTTEPNSGIAGVPIAPAIVVTMEDSLGNPVTPFTGTVTAALAANPGGATLEGSTSVTASAGTATFSNLRITRSGVGYTLRFATGSFSVVSAAFAISPAGPTALVFTTEPTATAAGSVISPAVQVAVEDSLGNSVTTYSGSISLGLSANPGNATLGGNTTVTVAGGVAAFPNLTVSRAGTGYTLAAATGSLSATSSAFTVTGAASTKLAFAVPPSSTAQSGVALAQQPGVQVEDTTGKAVAEAGVVVTASIASGPSATLAGASATTGANGLATFAGLAIRGPLGAYTLLFSASGAAPVTSGTVTLAAGAAAQLLVETQPSSAAQSGVVFAQQPVIQVADAAGNPVGSGGVAVTAKIASGAGTLAGTTTAVTGTSGAATFANLSIGGPLGARTLGFTASGLTGAVSSSIGLSAGPASAIALSAGANQSAPTGTATPVAPSVIVTDGFGNPVAGVSVTFTVAEGAISGTNPALTGSNGVAAIGSWTLGAQAGVDTLRATAAGLSGSPVLFVATATASVGSVSAALSTVAAAPSTIAASSGSGASTITVTAKDGNGTPISGATVVLAATGTGNTLTEPVGTTSSNGVATGFISSTGAGTKTVSATINGTAITQTASVTVTAAAAASIAPSAETSQSATVGTAVAVLPAVVVKDAFGNLVSGVSVTLAVTAGGGTVTPTVVSTNASGAASPSSWVLGTTAGANTLSASVAGLSGSPVTFNATGEAGSPSITNSLVAAAPTSVVASSGGSVAAITVTVRDAYGNPVSGVTVALSATGNGNALTQPGGPTGTDGTVSGTLSSTAAGSKSVSASVDGVGTLTETATVTVVAGSAAQLAFSVQPSATSAGATIAPPVEVSALDAFGNVATTFTGAVTVSLAGGDPLGSMSGTLTVTAVAGVATFSNLNIGLTSALGTYYLNAAAASVTGATSAGFNVTL